MGLWAYTYDTAGNLLTQTDARGTVLWFGYDGHNRLSEKRLTNSSGALLAKYYYDEAGYGSSIGRRTRSVAYVNGLVNNTTSTPYDARGRVTATTLNIDSANYTTGYSYDAADRVISQTYPDTAAEVVTTTYTPRGLLRTLTGASTYISDTFSNALGQVTRRYLGTNGVVRQAYSYTAAENFRLATLQSGTSPSYDNRQNLSYSYDNAGNVLSITDSAAYCGQGANTAEIFDLFAKYGKYMWFAQAYASIYEANVAEAQGDVYAADVRASSDAYLQQARNFLPQHDWRGDALLLVDANSAYQVGSTLTAGGAKVIGAWVGGIATKQAGTASGGIGPVLKGQQGVADAAPTSSFSKATQLKATRYPCSRT